MFIFHFQVVRFTSDVYFQETLAIESPKTVIKLKYINIGMYIYEIASI